MPNTAQTKHQAFMDAEGITQACSGVVTSLRYLACSLPPPPPLPHCRPCLTSSLHFCLTSTTTTTTTTILGTYIHHHHHHHHHPQCKGLLHAGDAFGHEDLTDDSYRPGDRGYTVLVREPSELLEL
jgi:hypothetical protein